MLLGIGTDIVDLPRVRSIVASSSGSRFLDKVLTAEEREIAGSRPGRLAEFAAGRFAAKEAVSKAAGCGIGGTLGFHDMEIVPDDAGKPFCRLSQAARERLGYSEDVRVVVSISHSGEYAVAFAAIEA